MTRREVCTFLFLTVLNPIWTGTIAFALAMCLCMATASDALRELRQLPRIQTSAVAATKPAHKQAFHDTDLRDNVEFVQTPELGALIAQGFVAFGQYAMVLPWEEFCPNLDSVPAMIEPFFASIEPRPMRLPLPAQTRLLICTATNRCCTWQHCLYRDAFRRGLWYQVLWTDLPGEHGCPFERICRLYAW